MNAELFPNGWQHYLVGGLLAGAGTALVFVATGVRAGASGFFTSTLSWPFAGLRNDWALRERSWRAAFALGTLAGGALWLAVTREPFTTAVAPWRLVVGGLLVGFGTRLSRGCTSGHGICGLSGGSRASLLAVLVFMGVAIVTAHVVRALGVSP